MQFIIMVVYVICSVAGVVLFKLGSQAGLSVLVDTSFFALKISWLSVIGLILYIVSFLLYMSLIAKNNLSYLIPVITGAVYVVTLIASVVIFKENITIYGILGSVFMLGGLILMNVKR